MRKILSILLLVVLGLPSALPLVAAVQDGDAGLPACCRRAGAHHCAMDAHGARVAVSAADADALRGLRVMRAAGEACPYRCGAWTRVHVRQDLMAAPGARWYAAVVAHPAMQAQTESRWRVARERARGKRGPPMGGRVS